MRRKYRFINIMMMAFFVIAAIAGGKTINVNAVAVVNNPPVAYPQTVTVTAGESIEIAFEGSDVDGDPLLLYYIDNTTKGTLYDSENLNATMYFAWASSSGVDSFHIVASDGQSLSEPALVTINIVPVITNHAPKTYNNYVATNEDTVVTAQLFASDPDGDPLTYSIETGPLNGILSGSGPSLSYTPDPDFNGTDSFTYSVSDGQLTSNVSTLFLTILPISDPPVAYPQTVTVTAGESIEIAFEGSDVDGDPLLLYYIDNTTKGTLYDSENLNATMYFAWASSSGVDSFHIVASDGQSLSEPALVTINIVPVITNHAPKTYNNYVATNEDTVVTAQLFASDPDGDPLTYSIETGPLNGILSGSGPSLSYTPDPDFNGTDSFTYSVSDGQLTSNVSTLFLTILPVNDAPVADPQSVTLTAGEDKAITLTGSDVDEDPLSYVVVSNPVNGSLSGTAPALVYTPNAGYSGPDSFTFKVNDGVLDSTVSTVSITVTSPQPTTVFFDNFETDKGWIRNPNGTDRASKGMWERANPESVRILGKYTQLGSTVSGTYDLVTGHLAGNLPTRHDVDGGVTTIRSPRITLPAGRNLTISFSYYFAHLADSSSADYLKVKIIGATTNTILQELGNRKNDYAAWAAFSGDLSSYAGQSIYIQIECADMAGESLVEAAIDDILIIAQ